MEVKFRIISHQRNINQLTKNRLYMKKLVLFFSLIFLTIFNFYPQKSTYVDSNGVFRWVKSDKEIRLFGINYTLPFAHGYRAINYLNKDHKEAIDKDVYHFTKLGIDGYRVHIWDVEITDSIGNVLNTPQLDLLDYLLFKLKERGIKTIVTPFKVGGNGYPEKDFPTPGFSSKMGKWQTYSGKEILEKQKRYFTQLLNHINPYTNLAYKDDPDIIALEINNEPRHDNGEVATKYINYMVNVIRKAGFKNPIFYNVSERSKYIDDYLKTDIQGCTFQWYPTGLVHNSLLSGNYLPNVNKYEIPFKSKESFQNKAKIIYEFDPGDTNSSVLFPAMARSFRESGFQFVAQFAYDPIDLAFANTEYQTHYLNLAYTPSKAISLKIASEAFHEIPKEKYFGSYPENNEFLNTTLYPENNVAVYNSSKKFMYSNTTNTKPIKLNSLEEIVGIGNSSIIKYNGTGAYFLNKLEKGVWRLEVFPDVLWVNDPFQKASLKKTVAILQNNNNTIEVNLPDLKENFLIEGINKGNNYKSKATLNKISIKPGTYILSNRNTIDNFKKIKINNFQVDEFYNIKQKVKKTYLVHKPLEYLETESDLEILAKIISPNNISKVEVVLPAGYQKTDNYKMIKTDNFNYQLTIPKAKIKGDTFSYYITVYTNKGNITYPGNINGNPLDWDFVSQKKYTTHIVGKDSEIMLFDASITKFDDFLWPRQWNAVKYNINKIRFKNKANNLLSIKANNLIANNPDITFKVLLKDIVYKEKNNISTSKSLIIRASSGEKSSQKLQIALQLNNGQVFGKTILLSPLEKEFTIPFSELKSVPMVLLPRPYPDFQPYYFQSSSKEEFDINKLDALQISIGPEINNVGQKEKQEVFIKSIVLK